MKKSILILFFFIAHFSVYAQLSTNELPISFDSKLVGDIDVLPEAIIMPELDMDAIEAEDMVNDAKRLPPRFGYRHKVNYDLTNSGIWHEMPNGDRLWQLRVICPKAQTINLLYDKFWLPEGGKMFVYSTDRKHHIGAFTEKNNKGNRMGLRGFATELVCGDDIIIEYYQPNEVVEKAIISIEYIVHGYRYVSHQEAIWDTLAPCEVNINCEEGQNWQAEKKAVAKIALGGSYWGTGALINTSSNSQTPYFLTANHCISDYIFYQSAHGISNPLPNMDQVVFYWDYESSGCNNVPETITYYTTTGASMITRNSIFDCALLQLTEDPKQIPNYNPCYLGWDCSGNSGNAGVCIHHPGGRIKKISTVAYSPTAYQTYFWEVHWRATLNGHGVTAGGSSGSPLLNSEHRIIGHLHQGTSSCPDSTNADYYSKFDKTCVIIGSYLGSNSSTQTVDGLFVICHSITISTYQDIYSKILITQGGQCTISGDLEMHGNCNFEVESGGTLIIDGGSLTNVNLVLHSGASIEILNGGIIETQNGFVAPIGATVNIVHGQII